jgi:D-alanyl-D-alanine carboxypeptidase
VSKEFPPAYLERIKSIHESLGIPEDYEREYKLWLQTEASEQDLVSAGKDVFSREQFLLADVEKRWRVMRKTAQRDFVELSLVSCFRSVDYQKQLIEKKLAAGQAIEEILKVSAAPGHSEHHTGRAIDVGTSGCEHLSEAFEETVAFQWLLNNGEKYGFRLSYPKDNISGIAYEPWHWAYDMY